MQFTCPAADRVALAVDRLARKVRLILRGIGEARADTVSSYVLQERNVTPYNADTRWASHVYPIYLAETYLRSSFLSKERFKALIF